MKEEIDPLREHQSSFCLHSQARKPFEGGVACIMHGKCPECIVRSCPNNGGSPYASSCSDLPNSRIVTGSGF